MLVDEKAILTEKLRACLKSFECSGDIPVKDVAVNIIKENVAEQYKKFLDANTEVRRHAREGLIYAKEMQKFLDAVSKGQVDFMDNKDKLIESVQKHAREAQEILSRYQKIKENISKNKVDLWKRHRQVEEATTGLKNSKFGGALVAGVGGTAAVGGGIGGLVGAFVVGSAVVATGGLGIFAVGGIAAAWGLVHRNSCKNKLETSEDLKDRIPKLNNELIEALNGIELYIGCWKDVEANLGSIGKKYESITGQTTRQGSFEDMFNLATARDLWEEIENRADIVSEVLYNRLA